MVIAARFVEKLFRLNTMRRILVALLVVAAVVNELKAVEKTKKQKLCERGLKRMLTSVCSGGLKDDSGTAIAGCCPAKGKGCGYKTLMDECKER